MQIELRKIINHIKITKTLSLKDLNTIKTSTLNEKTKQFSSQKIQHFENSKSHKKENNSDSIKRAPANINYRKEKTISNFNPNTNNSERINKNTASSNKENMPEIKQKNKILFSKNTLIDKESNEVISEDNLLSNETNDLFCCENIQDWKFNAIAQQKSSNLVMPNIIEETDEEMSNNCSPNKTELLAQLMKKQKMESKFLISYEKKLLN